LFFLEPSVLLSSSLGKEEEGCIPMTKREKDHENILGFHPPPLFKKGLVKSEGKG